MFRKLSWFLSLIALLSFTSCGSGSSEEAKELLEKVLKLVGIPQSIVVNICQDENRDGICGVSELQVKVSIEKGDTVATIWKRIKNTADGKYLLETYDPTLPLLLELQDTDSEHYTDKFTIPFDGLASTEKEKDLSILQAMVDAGYLTTDEISAVGEMDNDDIFYETLLKDFEINLNTLAEQNLSSPRAVLANIKEMAEELKDVGIADELPKRIDSCEDNDSCVEEAMEETIIDENESVKIKDEESKITKELFAGKTLYSAYNDDGVDITEKIIFNSDATGVTWQEIKGGTESGTDSITINGSIVTTTDNEGSEEHEIIRVTSKYIEIKNYDGIDRFYFTQSDAEEALASQNGESDSKTPTNNGFTKEMLKNKVLYHHAYTEDDGAIGYGKMTVISETSWERREIRVSADGETIEEDETFTVPYILEDGKIKSDAGNDYRYLIFNSQDDTAWYVTEEVDRGKDGTIDESENDTLYFSKPADFPAEL